MTQLIARCFMFNLPQLNVSKFVTTPRLQPNFNQSIANMSRDVGNNQTEVRADVYGTCDTVKRRMILRLN